MDAKVIVQIFIGLILVAVGLLLKFVNTDKDEDTGCIMYLALFFGVFTLLHAAS